MTMPFTIDEYGLLARDLISRRFFSTVFGDYSDADLDANRANREAFDRARLIARVLRPGTPSSVTTVLGQRIDAPVMIAPVGLHRRFTPEGELATARAAARAGTIFVPSAASGRSFEEIAEAAPEAGRWAQLYFFQDRALTEDLVRRAESGGYGAIVLTVDNMKHFSARRQPYKNELAARSSVGDLVMGNFTHLPEDHEIRTDYFNFQNSWKHDLSWPDVEWLMSITSLPLVLKGIQAGEDAAIAAKTGVAGVIVSNHGGHALANARATFDGVAEVSDAVGDSLEVYLDGGIRSGDSVLKAIARGARAVFVGRAVIWSLIVGGEDALVDALDILRGELLESMGLCGLDQVVDITEDALWDIAASAPFASVTRR